jgi:hypothetical protein
LSFTFKFYHANFLQQQHIILSMHIIRIQSILAITKLQELF